MENDLPIRSSKKTAMLVAYGLLLTGLSLILVGQYGADHWKWDSVLVGFVREVGLLFSAVAAATILHERLMRDEMRRQIIDELSHTLDAKIPPLERTAQRMAEVVHNLFCAKPPGMTGLRLITDVRRNFSGYYGWVTESNPQDLFFAGRSVLHRIDADIHSRTNSSAEAILLRRLREGSKIRINFLDPRCDIVDRLAKEEGEIPAALLGNIATSLGICRRLGNALKAEYQNLPTGAVLSIRVYDRAPYFAYHKQDDDVLVGFYFQSLLGSSSSAFQVMDDTTKRTFRDHFVRIHADAASTTMVEFDGAAGRPLFNDVLYDEITGWLARSLGPTRVEELLAGRYVGNDRLTRVNLGVGRTY